MKEGLAVKKSRFCSRYEVATDLLKDKRGTLIDLGSRDRILRGYLERNGAIPRITYYSADLEGIHDYAVDLERPFPFKDREFDYVVILDVLEHLENIHNAFDECARVARRAVIASLPNMATLIHRWNYLKKGRLKTGKYDLLAEHQGDRHRWLTNYENTISFISSRAEKNGISVSAVVGCRDFYSLTEIGAINRLYSIAGQFLMPPALYCNTLVFEIRKDEPPGH